MCDAFLYACVLEQKADLASGDRQFLLVGDNVFVHDAGLPHPRFGSFLGLETDWRRNERETGELFPPVFVSFADWRM